MKSFLKKLEEKLGITIIKSSSLVNFTNTYWTKENDDNLVALRLCQVLLNTLKHFLPIADTLKELSLSECGLEIIDCIKQFTNLSKLDISSNSISSLKGLENLWKLEELNLAATDIKSNSKYVELRALDKLEYLNLNYTDVGSVSGLEHLINLNKLSLKGANNMTTFSDTENMGNLRSLNLDACHYLNFYNLGLENFTCLKILNLGNCIVKSFNGLKNLTTLKQLILHGALNVPVPIDLNGLRSLQFLDLSDTSIDKVQRLETLSNLMMLNLATNNINKIEGLNFLENLKFIYLRDNKISFLEKNNFANPATDCIADVGLNDIINYDIELGGKIKFVYNFEGAGLVLTPIDLSFDDVDDVQLYCRQLKQRYNLRIDTMGLASSLKIEEFFD
ncbi:MAG: leucine-rich repeat domain-containing protein [Sphingobacteriales bacterium]|nr:MAG: leucine-rich repeat domain-containing protein [Sphingobacteriales bacterium]